MYEKINNTHGIDLIIHHCLKKILYTKKVLSLADFHTHKNYLHTFKTSLLILIQVQVQLDSLTLTFNCIHKFRRQLIQLFLHSLGCFRGSVLANNHAYWKFDWAEQYSWYLPYTSYLIVFVTSVAHMETT